MLTFSVLALVYFQYLIYIKGSVYRPWQSTTYLGRVLMNDSSTRGNGQPKHPYFSISSQHCEFIRSSRSPAVQALKVVLAWLSVRAPRSTMAGHADHADHADLLT